MSNDFPALSRSRLILVLGLAEDASRQQIERTTPRLLTSLKRRLAAVGRLALTNYLMQTVICTSLFYGWGLGLFDKLDRFALLGVVLMVSIFQLLISLPWLARFRFGPAEWLWRSLTYFRRQPMRVR